MNDALRGKRTLQFDFVARSVKLLSVLICFFFFFFLLFLFFFVNFSTYFSSTVPREKKKTRAGTEKRHRRSGRPAPWTPPASDVLAGVALVSLSWIMEGPCLHTVNPKGVLRPL